MQRPPRRLPDLAIAIFVLACLAWGVDARWHASWDGGIYVLTAQSLAAGEGYRYLGAPFFLRPPGFSWLLSWLVAPSGDVDFHALNLAMMVIAMAALVAVYAVLCRFLDRPRAAAIALAFGTSAAFVGQLNVVMSDLLFLLLVFAALGFLLPQRDGTTPFWKDALATVTIAAALYVRTAGVVLLPLALVQRRLVGAVQVALVLLALAPWLQFAGAAADAAPKPSTQLLNFTYGTPMLHTDSRDPTSPYLPPRKWVGRAARNAVDLAEDVGRVLGLGTGIGAAAATLAVGYGFAAVARRRWSLLEWFALAYAGLIVVYAYYESRLILPLVVCVYYYFMAAVEDVAWWWARRAGRTTLAPTIWAGVVACLLAANVAALPTSRASTPTEDTFPLRAAVPWIRANTPGDATLLTDLAPDLSVLTGRRAYSYLYLGTAPLPAADYVVLHGTPAAFEPAIALRSSATVALPSGSGPESVRIYRLRDARSGG